MPETAFAALTIISRRAAFRLQREAMSDPKLTGQRIRRFRYDLGKYGPTPSHFVGRSVRAFPGILAVYAERRKDRDGLYTALCTITCN